MMTIFFNFQRHQITANTCLNTLLITCKYTCTVTVFLLHVPILQNAYYTELKA